MGKSDPAKLKKVTVSIPFGMGSAEWEADSTERKAAWSLYVELVTRIAVQPLDVEHGLLREVLNSLYSLFGTTREILKAAGPDVGASRESVGGIAIMVLNKGLRPFIAQWHPALLDWEAQRPLQLSAKEHEENWANAGQMRVALKKLRGEMERYAETLAAIAGVEN
jgi:hypothetical protein